MMPGSVHATKLHVGCKNLNEDRRYNNSVYNKPSLGSLHSMKGSADFHPRANRLQGQTRKQTHKPKRMLISHTVSVAKQSACCNITLSGPCCAKLQVTAWQTGAIS